MGSIIYLKGKPSEETQSGAITLQSTISNMILNIVMLKQNTSDTSYQALRISDRVTIRETTTLRAKFMGPTWGPQDSCGPHVGHVNLVIWVNLL